jgi:hypothetical protein
MLFKQLMSANLVPESLRPNHPKRTGIGSGSGQKRLLAMRRRLPARARLWQFVHEYTPQ